MFEYKGKEDADMAGLMVFKSLTEALKYGFQVYDRTKDGYIVRIQTDAGWAMAVVICD